MHASGNSRRVAVAPAVRGPAKTFDRDYFERLYERDADPWRYRSSLYEERKHAATIASLAQPRYARALDLGCSIGVLTQRLAAICDDVVAVDTSMRALTAARESCRGNITFKQAHLPGGDWGEGFDLIVLSEILCYLQSPAIAVLARRIRQSALPGAECIAVHGTGYNGCSLSGDAVSELFQRALPGTPLASFRTRHYRLDHWRIVPHQALPAGGGGGLRGETSMVDARPACGLNS
ncbi:class I SAM-dependent DNA methyltransferase [Rhodanobacter umsongensis]|uniref:Class I SAM-dependent DNA methyltransferase n=1 Tax=Rhodanobacter umsongensis TaxID=633153 RepID=A0ABW0JP57_9GAMM